MIVSRVLVWLRLEINPSQPKDPQALDAVHQTILRLNQILGEFPEQAPWDGRLAVSQKDHLANLKQKLYHCIDFLQKRDESRFNEALNEIIAAQEGFERALFDSMYPLVKQLFSILAMSQAIPTPETYAKLGLNPEFAPYLIKKMETYYENGEPQFSTAQNKNGDNKPEPISAVLPNGTIRGRPVEAITIEIKEKYVQTGEADARVLWLPDLILKGGFSFRESKILSEALEKQGIIVERSLFKDSVTLSDFDAVLMEFFPSEQFDPLDWEGSMEFTNSAFTLCKKCGLPRLPPADGIETENNCVICKERH